MAMHGEHMYKMVAHVMCMRSYPKLQGETGYANERVHGVAWRFKRKSFASTLGSLDISPPPLPTPTSPTIPAGGLEYMRVFSNSNKEATRVHCKLAYLA